MNFLGQGFQKLEHYGQTDRQTDRQTDATENIITLHLWVVNSKKNRLILVMQSHWRQYI